MARALTVLFIAGAVAGGVFAPTPRSVFAQGADFGLKEAYDRGQVSDFASSKNVAEIAGNVLEIVLGLLALVSLIVIIFAGAIWMQARGNEEDVQKARDMLKYSVLGMIIALSGYAALNMMTRTLITIFEN